MKKLAAADKKKAKVAATEKK